MEFDRRAGVRHVDEDLCGSTRERFGPVTWRPLGFYFDAQHIAQYLHASGNFLQDHLQFGGYERPLYHYHQTYRAALGMPPLDCVADLQSLN